MRVGIMGAMTEEVVTLKEDMTDVEATVIGERTFYQGKLYDVDTVLVFSRWGKVAAASTATTLCDRFDVDMLIFTGVAGATAERLNIGDVVIADKLLQHDVDATPIFPRHQIPLTGRSEFETDTDLRAQAYAATERFLANLQTAVTATTLNKFGVKQPKAVIGTIASGDQFISDSAVAADIKARIPDLQCLEMEGGAVAQVCAEHNTPFIVVRTISDRADHSADIDFQAFVKDVATH